jgi:hypothetical protein
MSFLSSLALGSYTPLLRILPSSRFLGQGVFGTGSSFSMWELILHMAYHIDFQIIHSLWRLMFFYFWSHSSILVAYASLPAATVTPFDLCVWIL